jgi:hypothetical protein
VTPLPIQLRGEPLPDDAVIVVRARTLDADRVRRTATASHEDFGFYGLSAFAALDTDVAGLFATHVGNMQRYGIHTDGGGRVVKPQILLDYHRVAPGGLTRARRNDVRPGVQLSQWDYVVVGDEDAEPAVAQVVDVSSDGAILLRILEGSVAHNAHLLSHDRLVG